jgi:T-box protein 6
MRVSLSGLDNDQNYCVLLEMVPVADCRFKFSGSQWVPAGGAEPQSLQNIYIHPDSPALGSHWQAQPINFNKTKLTNNTLDSSGHVSLNAHHPLSCFVVSSTQKNVSMFSTIGRYLRLENGVKEVIID